MFYFYCDASKEIGFGHLQRCILIAQYLKTALGKLIAFIETSATVKNHLNLREIDTITTIEALPPNQTIIFDVAHEKNLSSPEKCCQLINHVHQLGHRIIFIDGLGNHRFNPQSNTMPIVDLIVTPYLGSLEQPFLPYKKWLPGKDFILVDPKLKEMNIRSSDSVSSTLVTMGGTDKFNITLQVLNALRTNPHVHINVVLGSFFSYELKSSIQKLTMKFPNFHLIDSPITLLPYYRQTDLVVCSTGITTYEVLAAGLPSIQISPTITHSDNFAHFDQCMVHLGYYKTLSDTDVQTVFEDLLTDKTQRAKIAAQAKQMIDGDGLKRVALALLMVG